MSSSQMRGQGSLTLVATPIGNLEDITLRALRLLREADLIAAEDTRQTLRLLNYFEIKKPMISCHDLNEREKSAYLVEKMSGGQHLVLVSDAGTPGISDPGAFLIGACIGAGIPVTMAPGPSAAIMGLVLSGLTTKRFCFEGFLPSARKDRKRHLESLTNETRTLIFYEAPHRLRAVLEDMREVFGNRKCALARELTKMHEEVLRDTLDDLLTLHEERAPRGEYVVVIEGADWKAQLEQEQETWQALSISEHVQLHLHAGLPRMEAMKRAAKERGVTKREVYASLQGHEKEKETD